MNIKEYIESGIVAGYVLGLASEGEQQEFESLCNQYPEVMQAKETFELILEAQLIKEAVNPPKGLKEKISLSLNDGGDGLLKPERNHITPVRKMNVWKWIAAASILLLAGSIYFNYTIRKKYQELYIANTHLKSSLDHPVYHDAIKKLEPIVKKPSVKWSIMLEPANPAHCMAHIYWDSISTNTYLLIGKIPPPISNKQFQLWALLNNLPINLGVFDIMKEGQLVQMKNVEQAQTFVITMEQKGGSITPTMEATYAIGKL